MLLLLNIQCLFPVLIFFVTLTGIVPVPQQPVLRRHQQQHPNRKLQRQQECFAFETTTPTTATDTTPTAPTSEECRSAFEGKDGTAVIPYRCNLNPDVPRQAPYACCTKYASTSSAAPEMIQNQNYCQPLDSRSSVGIEQQQEQQEPQIVVRNSTTEQRQEQQQESASVMVEQPKTDSPKPDIATDVGTMLDNPADNLDNLAASANSLSTPFNLEKTKQDVSKEKERCDTARANGQLEDVTVNSTEIAAMVSKLQNSGLTVAKKDAEAVIPGLSDVDTLAGVCRKVDIAFAYLSTKHPCSGVGSFTYRPSQCDPGYWCGCANADIYSSNDNKCTPSNNTNDTQWVGKYTEQIVDPITNATITTGNVYVGLAVDFPPEYFKCNDTLYCPGMNFHGNDFNSTNDCPNLCKEGYFCPSPKQKLICPIGSYCRKGSIQPTSCTGIAEKCTQEGMLEPEMYYSLVIVAGVALIAFGFIICMYRFLSKMWPFHNNDDDDDDDDEDGDFNDDNENGADRLEAPSSLRRRLTKHSVAKEKMEVKLLRKQSVVTVPKPSFMIDVEFDRLQRTLKNGVCIMHGVTGQLQVGQFTAIMGPSGAGKSTFLSLLAGKDEPTGGTVSVNGKVASLKDYRDLVGFVPQEDIMLRELTVEENIQHSAMMRLPTDLPYEEKLKRVEKVMASLDLLHIRNNIIGDELVRGVSGGQRKRVNVAMELVASPSLLALDEPTSGLDSTTSSKLCETLSKLASTGVNVAAVIHQPKIEILEKFTDVLLLGVGGKTVYIGPTQDMTSYFTEIGFPLPSQTNPADYYMDVIAGIIPCETNPNFKKEDLFALWARSPYNPSSKDGNDDDGKKINAMNESVANRATKRMKHGLSQVRGKKKNRVTTNICGQTCLLFKRSCLQRFRVPRNTLIPLFLSAGAACLIGYYTKTIRVLYYGIPLVVSNDDKIPLLKASSEFMKNYPIPPTSQIEPVWLFTALAIMLICIVSINTFGLEEAVQSRDSFSGTNPTSYWFAKTLEAGIWLPLYAAVYSSVQCTFSSLPIPMLQYWIVVWISMIGFSGVGHVVSLTVGPTNRGIVHLISCLLLIMAFSGVMIKSNGHKIFTIFFTYWTAQGYSDRSSSTYDAVFAVELMNSYFLKYDFDYEFWENMLYGFLTGLLWHFIVLIILIYRMR